MASSNDPNMSFQAGVMMAVLSEHLREMEKRDRRAHTGDDEQRMFARTFLHALKPEVAELMIEYPYTRLPALARQEWEEIKKAESAKV